MNTKLQKVLGALLMLIALPMSAYDLEVDGIFYTVTSLTDLTCSVTYGDRIYSGTVVIPPTIVYNNRTLTVTKIEAGAFKTGNQIRSLTIPNTISSIPDGAFSGCTSLDTLIIQDGDTSIDLGVSSGTIRETVGNTQYFYRYGPFDGIAMSYVYVGRNIVKKRYATGGYGIYHYYYDHFTDSKLKVAEIGSKVTSMPCFNYSKSLQKVILNKGGAIEIGDSVFYGCSKLSDISINNNVQTIGRYAFCYCSSLTSIDFPNVRTISSDAFSNCSSLASVDIPNVQTIGSEAFYICSSLTSIDIPNVQTIGDGAFAGCSSLASVDIPNVQTIGSYAFSSATRLKTIDLPLSLVSIGSSAFNGTSITEIVVPDMVKVLNAIFPSCIQSITLGNSIKSIASGAFKCNDLKTINIHTATPPSMPESACGAVQYMNVCVNVPIGTKEAYMQAQGWKNFWDINEIDFTGIESVVDGSADLAFTSTSDGITLSGADGQRVRVYGMNGEELLNIGNYYGQTLSLPKGLYVVKAGLKTLKVRL